MASRVRCDFRALWGGNVSYAFTITDAIKSTEYDDYKGMRSLDVIRAGISYSF